MTPLDRVLEELRREASSALAGARAAEPVALRVRLEPGELPEAELAGLAASAPATAFYWRHPAEERSLLGLGSVRAARVSGAGRFADADEAAGTLFARLRVAGAPATADAGPLLVGGFAFEDEPAREGAWKGFPAGELVLPRLLVVRRAGEAWLTVAAESPARLEEMIAGGSLLPVQSASAVAEPSSGASEGPEYRVRADRSHGRYRDQVEAARRAIAAGDLEKVVLARSLRVRHDARFDVAGLLARLARSYPRCVTFLVSRPEGRFLGATPELLVACEGRRVRTAAVAGSAPRGRTPEEDERLGRELRESKKEQEEHAVVVRAIRDALSPACKSLEIPEAPELLRIEGIQHLSTPIAGVLPETGSLLELAGRLHPTPAVGGAPAAAARDWIRRVEGMERGWYAGPVGWVDAAGGGELRVALRSGLIRSREDGDEALLYGGGGLVADSDPARELEETRVKLRALLAPLTEI